MFQKDEGHFTPESPSTIGRNAEKATMTKQQCAAPGAGQKYFGTIVVSFRCIHHIEESVLAT